jgi:hypothetical protein
MKFSFFIWMLLSLSFIFTKENVYSKVSILQDSISERHLIPLDILGWKVVFEIATIDNPDERGIIVYHLTLDGNGNILSLALLSKNVSETVEKAYRKKIKSTWQVLGYKDKNYPALTEGDYALHVSPVQ